MAWVTGFEGESPGTIIQFVDSIQETPGVRLVLNDFAPFYTTFADWSPGPLRRSVTSSMLADGDTITGSRHANRTIELTLQFKTASPDVAAAALSLLAAELGRDNILMVQHESRPTFFRTYRSSDYKLEMLNHDIDFAKQTITLVAEPYGLGLPVFAVSNQQLDPDPANGGEYLDIDGVLGDVETPLLIQLQGPPAGSGPDSDEPGQMTGTSVIGVRRGGNPSLLQHWVQAEDCISAYDTAPSGVVFDDNSGRDPGPSGNFQRCTFAVYEPMTHRLGWAFNLFPNADTRGAYRLYARARVFRDVPVGADGTVITLQAFCNGSPLLKRNGQVTTTVPNDSSNGNYVIDLGTFHVPSGPDPVTFGYSNHVIPVGGGVIDIWAARASGGTGVLDIDYLFLVPVDDQFAAITWDTTVQPDSFVVLDGPSDAIYQVDGPLTSEFPDFVPDLIPSAHGAPRGALPMVSPGDNRLYVITKAYTSVVWPGLGGRDVIGTPPTTVTVVYWPRYLALATA